MLSGLDHLLAGRLEGGLLPVELCGSSGLLHVFPRHDATQPLKENIVSGGTDSSAGVG